MAIIEREVTEKVGWLVHDYLLGRVPEKSWPRGFVNGDQTRRQCFCASCRETPLKQILFQAQKALVYYGVYFSVAAPLLRYSNTAVCACWSEQSAKHMWQLHKQSFDIVTDPSFCSFLFGTRIPPTTLGTLRPRTRTGSPQGLPSTTKTWSRGH
jgi:hypothetical protein